MPLDPAAADRMRSRRQLLLALGTVALAGCGAPVIAAPAAAPKRPAPPPAARPPQTTTAAAIAEPPPPPPGPAEPPPPDRWILALPPRDPAMETGTAFLERIKRLPRRQLDEAVIGEVLSGNVPPYQRRLVPLELRGYDTAGAEQVVTVHVLCDYLAIGSDDDFINIPMTAQAAQRIAGKLACILPTPKLVDEIWRAAVQLKPLYIEGGPDPDLDRHDDYLVHKGMLDEQRRAANVVLGSLVAGTKKDIVITNRLVDRGGKVAIYGWHKRDGQPIQPLSTRHSRIYADYSHGVRLVADRVMVGGEERALVDLLCDDQLCPLLSNEGPLEVPVYPS